MKKRIEVVGALIEKEEKILICQRPKNKGCALLWEFVGGKVEKGETKREALKRECFEELKIQVLVGEEFASVSHEYEHATVDLTVFKAKIIEGTPQNLEHNDIRWVSKSELDNFEFCPADEPILTLIKNS